MQECEGKTFHHNLRHYGASKSVDEGVPITVIQVLLGHQRPTTTDIYLQSIRPDMIEAMEWWLL